MTDQITISEPDQAMTEALGEVGVSLKTTERDEVLHHVTAIDFRLPDRDAKKKMLILHAADGQNILLDPGAPATFRRLAEVGMTVVSSKEGFTVLVGNSKLGQFAKEVDWYVTLNPETSTMLAAVVSAVEAAPPDNGEPANEPPATHEPPAGVEPAIPNEVFEEAASAAGQMTDPDPEQAFIDYCGKLSAALNEVKAGTPKMQMAYFKAMTGHESFSDAFASADTVEHLIGLLQHNGKNGNAPKTKVNGYSQPVETRVAAPASKPRPAQNRALSIAQPLPLTTPGLADWEFLRQKAAMLIRTGFLPKALKTEDQVMAIWMYGDLLKLEPMAAILAINVIDGKPTLSPQGMIAIAQREQLLEDMSIVDKDGVCTVTVKNRNQKTPIVASFSAADADMMQTAKWVGNERIAIPLSQKDNWKQQPKVMRQWRAVAAAFRIAFPSLFLGFYTADEMGADVVYTVDGIAT